MSRLWSRIRDRDPKTDAIRRADGFEVRANTVGPVVVTRRGAALTAKRRDAIGDLAGLDLGSVRARVDEALPYGRT